MKEVFCTFYLSVPVLSTLYTLYHLNLFFSGSDQVILKQLVIVNSTEHLHTDLQALQAVVIAMIFVLFSKYFFLTYQTNLAASLCFYYTPLFSLKYHFISEVSVVSRKLFRGPLGLVDLFLCKL